MSAKYLGLDCGTQSLIAVVIGIEERCLIWDEVNYPIEEGVQ
jgi:sugar (pentulose or hexulose) kinase